MQDIADACGLSRNTVSKIFNNRGEVPDATRKLVLEKARQLGYYQFPAKEEPAATHGGTIAVLTQKKLLSHNFGAYFITNQLHRQYFPRRLYHADVQSFPGGNRGENPAPSS